VKGHGTRIKGVFPVPNGLDGACINWAEEFFSRMRRAEIGHHHHIAGAALHLPAGITKSQRLQVVAFAAIIVGLPCCGAFFASGAFRHLLAQVLVGI
jgi:hypothetical protein